MMSKTDPEDVLEKLTTAYEDRTLWLSRSGSSNLKLELGLPSVPSSQYSFLLISRAEALRIARRLLSCIEEEG